MVKNALTVTLAFLLPIAPASVGTQLPAGPSPSPTRTEIEAFLQNGRIVIEPDVSADARQHWQITIDDGTRKHAATVETATASGATPRDYRFNVAAYELDKALELHMVSPSVLRTTQGRPASVTWWVDDVLTSELARRKAGIAPPDLDAWDKQVQAVRVFDELTANAYRNMSPESYTAQPWDNLLITKTWNIQLIDHTRTFRTGRQLEYPLSLTRCDRTVLSRLRDLTRVALQLKLGRYLDSDQLDALEARRVLIVKLFGELIASRGAAAVLYDLTRPADSSPAPGSGSAVRGGSSPPSPR